jgi:hypothetical protein
MRNPEKEFDSIASGRALSQEVARRAPMKMRLPASRVGQLAILFVFR